MSNHPVVAVKVTAYVDEGIAPLVEAMNEIEGVLTVDSCQGDGERPAHVFFTHIGDLLAFTGDLARDIAPRLRDRDYRIQLEWACGGERPLGHLVVLPRELPAVVTALREISAARKNPRHAG